GRHVAIPKLIDFGLAKSSTNEPLSSQIYSEGFEGSKPYSGPEQLVQYEHDELTQAVDVYGLSSVLFELLVGVTPMHHVFSDTRSKPFDKDVRYASDERPSPLQAFNWLSPEQQQRVAASRSTSVAGIRRNLNGALKLLMASALAVQPEHRLQDVSHLRENLERFLNGEPLRYVKREPLYSRMNRRFQRNPIPYLAIAAVIFVLTVGVVGTTWQWQRAESATLHARQQEQVAISEAERANQQADVADRRLLLANQFVMRSTNELYPMIADLPVADDARNTLLQITTSLSKELSSLHASNEGDALLATLLGIEATLNAASGKFELADQRFTQSCELFYRIFRDRGLTETKFVTRVSHATWSYAGTLLDLGLAREAIDAIEGVDSEYQVLSRSREAHNVGLEHERWVLLCVFAEAHYSLGQLEEAEKIANTAFAELDGLQDDGPDNWQIERSEALLVLGEISHALGRSQRASELADRSISMWPVEEEVNPFDRGESRFLLWFADVNSLAAATCSDAFPFTSAMDDYASAYVALLRFRDLYPDRFDIKRKEQLVTVGLAMIRSAFRNFEKGNPSWFLDPSDERLFHAVHTRSSEHSYIPGWFSMNDRHNVLGVYKPSFVFRLAIDVSATIHPAATGMILDQDGPKYHDNLRELYFYMAAAHMLNADYARAYNALQFADTHAYERQRLLDDEESMLARVDLSIAMERCKLLWGADAGEGMGVELSLLLSGGLTAPDEIQIRETVLRLRGCILWELIGDWHIADGRFPEAVAAYEESLKFWDDEESRPSRWADSARVQRKLANSRALRVDG
ncbi:MAG: hypothetical protein AAF662_04410, partial [Pseudomonadota bacterium]